MRFMIIVKSDPKTEATADHSSQQSQDEIAAMMKFNEELVKAGVMLAGEGLHPSSKGVRVKFDGKKRSVIDGPFTEAKELVAGFWLWQCKSRDEAIEWLKRAPFQEGEVEIRQVFEDEEIITSPELLAKEKALRTQVESQRA